MNVGAILSDREADRQLQASERSYRCDALESGTISAVGLASQIIQHPRFK